MNFIFRLVQFSVVLNTRIHKTYLISLIKTESILVNLEESHFNSNHKLGLLVSGSNSNSSTVLNHRPGEGRMVLDSDRRGRIQGYLKTCIPLFKILKLKKRNPKLLQDLGKLFSKFFFCTFNTLWRFFIGIWILYLLSSTLLYLLYYISESFFIHLVSCVYVSCNSNSLQEINYSMYILYSVFCIFFLHSAFWILYNIFTYHISFLIILYFITSIL